MLLSKQARDDEIVTKRPKSLTRRGLSLLEVVVVISILGVLTGLILSAAQRVRASAARTQCADRIRQIGLALHSYHDIRGQLPPGMTYQGGKDPQPFLSWLARILPHVEQTAVWEQTELAFRQNPDFLTPPHIARSDVILLFLCPADSRITQSSSVDITGHAVAGTSYLGIVGRDAGVTDGLLYMDSRHKFSDASDGTSNTLLIGERPPSADLGLGWWYAGWGQDKNGDAEFLLGVRTRCYNRDSALCNSGPYHFRPAISAISAMPTISGARTRAGPTSPLRMDRCVFFGTKRIQSCRRWRPAPVARL